MFGREHHTDQGKKLRASFPHCLVSWTVLSIYAKGNQISLLHWLSTSVNNDTRCKAMGNQALDGSPGSFLTLLSIVVNFSYYSGVQGLTRMDGLVD